MRKLTLTQTESKLIKEFINGLIIEKNIYRKCLEFVVTVKKEYIKDEYIVCALFNTDGEIKGIARTKEGKKKEYKTIRGLINFLNKEYGCDLYKEYIEKLLLEVTPAAPAAAAQKEKTKMEEVKEMNNRIDFKNKIELSMGDKVELNVKIKRGQLEKLSIDEELKNEIYNHFMTISNKKKQYIGFSFFEKKGERIVNIELGKKCYEIAGVFNMLKVTEIDKRGNDKIYYLNVHAKKKEVFSSGVESSIKKTPAAKKEIKINSIIETTFEDGTSWIEYKVGDKYGYDITSTYKEGEEKTVEDIYNNDLEINKKAVEKNSIDICSNYLKGIIEECKQSDNEMWYVEFEDIRESLSACEDEVEQFITRLQEEVNKLGIDEYVVFYEDDAAITVYGGVITQFLF